MTDDPADTRAAIEAAERLAAERAPRRRHDVGMQGTTRGGCGSMRAMMRNMARRRVGESRAALMAQEGDR